MVGVHWHSVVGTGHHLQVVQVGHLVIVCGCGDRHLLLFTGGADDYSSLVMEGLIVICR